MTPAPDTPAGESGADEVEMIAELAKRHGLHVAVAESLTSGALGSRLGAGSEAADWFRGGVIAYDESVKFDLLGVTPGPVVTERCAQQMARGVAGLLGAEAAVAATGVGGPDPSEGKPAGTVVLSVVVRGIGSCHSLSLSGDPEEVIDATVEHALGMLAHALKAHGPGSESADQ